MAGAINKNAGMALAAGVLSEWVREIDPALSARLKAKVEKCVDRQIIPAQEPDGFWHYGLSGPPEVVVRMLGDAATPVALFTIGAVLWRAGQHAHTRTPARRFVPIALVKLFVHPLLVFGGATLAQKLGASLSSFQIMVLTLAAALPSASNVSLLAERYGADNGRIARIIMTSTVVAFASFSALAWLFEAQAR